MTDISHAVEVARERGRKTERWQFRALVAATYPLFLVASIVNRATASPTQGEAPRRRSVFVEAHATAAATLACAFMG